MVGKARVMGRICEEINFWVFVNRRAVRIWLYPSFGYR